MEDPELSQYAILDYQTPVKKCNRVVYNMQLYYLRDEVKDDRVQHLIHHFASLRNRV